MKSLLDEINPMVAAIAPWFRLRLPLYGPGLNPKHTIYALFNLYWNCNEKGTKIKTKKAKIGPFFCSKKKLTLFFKTAEKTSN